MKRNTLLILVITGIALAALGPRSAAAQSSEEKEDKTIYIVVVNQDEQYSIWPADREIPLGWREEGKRGLKAECLAYIEEVWTDMRPLSLRKKMEEEGLATKPSPAHTIVPEPKPNPAPAPAKQPEPQPAPQATLDDDGIATLLGELETSLPDLVTDEEQSTAIIDRWDARDDLAGKTKPSILALLFDDVKAVVADEGVRKAIWGSWIEKRP